jgi:hypothetical protein
MQKKNALVAVLLMMVQFEKLAVPLSTTIAPP